MTSTKLLISFVIIWIITCVWWFVTMSSASDMDCFRLENAIMEHKNSKGYKKIKAYKAVKELRILCKSDY